MALKLHRIAAHLSALLFTFGTIAAHAQGCILARSPEQAGLPTEQGGYLQPGHWQVTLGERHQFSYQHYVGDVYQEYRAQQGTQVENRINLVTLGLTYQVTPRISVSADIPELWASRKSQNSPIEYQATGVGDMIVTVNSWIRNPSKATRWNASIGLGAYLPTGNDDVKNTTSSTNTTTGVTTTTTAPVDYSIQPGTGGWGGVLNWSAYTTLGHDLTFYTDGNYIAMNGGTDGVQRSTSTTTPLNDFNSIADQYLLEAGIAIPISKVTGLTATVGPRWEGVPAYNLFPVSNDGFRRPGYAVTLGPGLEYTRSGNILSAGVYKAIRRDRTGSYPDSVYGTHGDAAFAQYVWLASYTRRF